MELAMVKTQYFIGIDLHKSVIQACVLDSSGNIVSESRHRGDSLQEGLEVVEGLTRWRDGGRLAVEAVGFNRWFVEACRAAGLDVTVVDPVKLNLRMLGRKTDRRDAYEIARRLMLGDIDTNAKSYFASTDEFAGRKVLRTRHHLVELRQQVMNQVRAMLASHRIETPRGNLYVKSNIRRLRAISMPALDLSTCLNALLMTLESIQGSIDNLTHRITELAVDKRVAPLVELPSVGPQTASTLVYELGDCSRFHSTKAVASYAGLAPRVAQSADKSHHGRVTKRGNAHLRFVLGQWAVRLMTRNAIVKAWAAPRLRRVHKNKLRTALARRLLIGVYITLTRGEAFSLERCLGI
jgi:transposase